MILQYAVAAAIASPFVALFIGLALGPSGQRTDHYAASIDAALRDKR